MANEKASVYTYKKFQSNSRTEPFRLAFTDIYARKFVKGFASEAERDKHIEQLKALGYVEESAL